MCEMSAHAARGVALSARGRKRWLRDHLWWLRRWSRSGRTLELSGWQIILCGGVMVGVASGGVGFWCRFAGVRGGDPMK